MVFISDKYNFTFDLTALFNDEKLDEDLSHISGDLRNFLKQVEPESFCLTTTGHLSELVAKELYNLTSDVNTAVAGLAYTYFSLENNENLSQNIENIFNSNTEISQHLKNLKILSNCISKFKITSTGGTNSFLDGENFRRLVFVVTRDIRALVIELVYRVVILENINFYPELKELLKESFIIETFKIFVPVANRLGLWSIKWKLEDYSFREQEPKIYSRIVKLLSETCEEREDYMNYCVDEIRNRLIENNFHESTFDVFGRTKNIYSIYAKMKQLHCYNKGTVPSKLSSEEFNKFLYTNFNSCFESVYDLIGIRVICSSVSDCYAALGVIHSLFHPAPTPRRKKSHVIDYIAAPKSNGYRSLHTVVTGPMHKRLEVQIRTYDMNAQAEYGIAAHWKYKEFGHSQSTSKEEYIFADIKKVIHEQGLSAVQNFLEGLNNDDIFGSEIYVFTPKGDVVSLAQGSTPVDFAYQIHTEVGNHCAGARINGRMVSLDTLLKNGDFVQIITHKNSHPSLDWLNFVVSSDARNRIRQWHKRANREESIPRGREFLEKEQDKIKPQQSLVPTTPTKELTTPVKPHRDTTPTTSPSTEKPIVGVEGLMYHLAGCCTPIPGEAIVGVVRRAKGISIHRQGCQNLHNVESERLVPVSWNPAVENSTSSQTYLVNIQIEALDRVGLFKDILSRLSDQGINVRQAQVKTSNGEPALIDLGIDIRNYTQLEQIFTQIKKLSDVLTIRRLEGV
jgi:guanosine-3',5'-bis(diphosphate) 3'-pyrophosphohydrolase